MKELVPLLFSSIALLLALVARYLEHYYEGAFSTISPMISLLSRFQPPHNPPGQWELHATPFLMIHDPGLVQSMYILGLTLAFGAAGMALVRMYDHYDSRHMAAIVLGLSALLIWDSAIFAAVLLILLFGKIFGFIRSWPSNSLDKESL